MELTTLQRLRDDLQAMIDEVSRHADHLLAAYLSNVIDELDHRITSASQG